MKLSEERHVPYEELKPHYRRLRQLKEDRDVAGLIRELDNPYCSRTLTVRTKAAMMLGDLRAEEATEALTGLLDDENVHVRRMVIVSLCKIGKRSDPAASRLLEIAESQDDPQDPLFSRSARELAIVALGTVGGTTVVPHITAFLDDPDRRLRENALGALVFANDPAGNEAAEAHMRQGGWRVRRRKRRIARQATRRRRKQARRAVSG